MRLAQRDDPAYIQKASPRLVDADDTEVAVQDLDRLADFFIHRLGCRLAQDDLAVGREPLSLHDFELADSVFAWMVAPDDEISHLRIGEKAKDGARDVLYTWYGDQLLTHPLVNAGVFHVGDVGFHGHEVCLPTADHHRFKLGYKTINDAFQGHDHCHADADADHGQQGARPATEKVPGGHGQFLNAKRESPSFVSLLAFPSRAGQAALVAQRLQRSQLRGPPGWIESAQGPQDQGYYQGLNEQPW